MVYALLRHGQTDWNVLGRVQGITDIPLNDVGRAQAAEAAALLAAQRDAGEATWAAVVSSPLVRARETAQIIADRLGLDLGPAYGEWREQDYGIGEGMIATDLWAAWPGWDQPGKEHDDEVVRRGLAALDRVYADYGDQDVIIVAHGNIIRYPLNRLVDRVLDDMANTSSATVRFTDGRWQVLRTHERTIGVELEP